MPRSLVLLSGALAAASLAASPAMAHPRLLASTPANNAVASNVTAVRMQFSEKLVPAFTRAELTMAATANRPVTPIPARSTILKDGRTMVVTSRTPLRPGHYTLNWHAVSTDTHRVDGKVSFAVR